MKANGTISIGVNRESPDSPMEETHSWQGGPIAWLRRDVFLILNLYGLYDEIMTGFRGRGSAGMIGQVFEWPVMIFHRTLTDDQILICRTDMLRGKLSVPIWRAEMTYHELKRSLIRILEIWRLAHRLEGEVTSWVNIRPIGWVNNLIKRILVRLGLRKRKLTINVKATDLVSGELERVRTGLEEIQQIQHKRREAEAELVRSIEQPLVSDPITGTMTHTDKAIKNLTIDPPELSEGFKDAGLTAEIIEDDGAGSPAIDE